MGKEQLGELLFTVVTAVLSYFFGHKRGRSSR